MMHTHLNLIQLFNYIRIYIYLYIYIYIYIYIYYKYAITIVPYSLFNVKLKIIIEFEYINEFYITQFSLDIYRSLLLIIYGLVYVS